MKLASGSGWCWLGGRCCYALCDDINVFTTSGINFKQAPFLTWLFPQIAWLASLDTAYAPERNYRRSSIICTIGPKTNSVEAINNLRKAGLNVVRMNFSLVFLVHITPHHGAEHLVFYTTSITN